MRRLAALVVLSLAALVVSTGAAAAHAELISMSPADASTVETPPAAVVLRYSEPIGRTGSSVVVTAPSGTPVSVGALSVLDGTVTQPLGTLTEPGRYQVSARVVSADGHPVEATGSFTVRTAATAGPTTARSAGPPAEDGSAAATIAVVAIPVVVLAGLAVMLLRRRRGSAGTP